MADILVGFPKPCGEAWEEMASEGCHRHCASCDKVVHDLAALSIDEAEALLDAPEEVCVRAQIATDGTIALRDAGRGGRKRMLAAFGAGLALSAAACQTVPPVDRANRFQIAASFAWQGWGRTAELRSSDGRDWDKRREKGTGRFIFEDLYPGVYDLTVRDSCGNRVPVQTITITDASVEIRDAAPEESCIIVGAMVKVKRPERA